MSTLLTIVDGFCLNIAQLQVMWAQFFGYKGNFWLIFGYKGVGNKIIPATGPNFGGQNRGPYSRNRV